MFLCHTLPKNETLTHIFRFIFYAPWHLLRPIIIISIIWSDFARRNGFRKWWMARFIRCGRNIRSHSWSYAKKPKSEQWKFNHSITIPIYRNSYVKGQWYLMTRGRDKLIWFLRAEQAWENMYLRWAYLRAGIGENSRFSDLIAKLQL